MHPGDDPKSYTLSFHRPLQKYFEALAQNGFAVVGFEEWVSHRKSKPGKYQAMEDEARKEIPIFLGILAKLIR